MVCQQFVQKCNAKFGVFWIMKQTAQKDGTQVGHHVFLLPLGLDALSPHLQIPDVRFRLKKYRGAGEAVGKLGDRCSKRVRTKTL